MIDKLIETLEMTKSLLEKSSNKREKEVLKQRLVVIKGMINEERDRIRSIPRNSIYFGN